MAKLSDLKVNENIKILIYGDSGAGKTCLASTFEGPVFFADFDGKVGSAARFLEKHPEQLAKIEYEDFRYSKADPQNSYLKFLAYLARLEELALQDKFPFKTVSIDSLTFMADAMIAHLLEKHTEIKRLTPGIPGQQDWNIILTEGKHVIKRILKLPCNVVFTGHIKDEKDEMTGYLRYKVALAGQLADALPRLLNEVYRAYVEKDKDGNFQHRLQTKSDKYICRTEIVGMPPVIQMSYQSIKAAMEGKYQTQNQTKENK